MPVPPGCHIAPWQLLQRMYKVNGLRGSRNSLLEELDDAAFKRVHRSTIVNLNCIEQVIPHTKGEYFLQMDNGERIKVSRNYRGAIKLFLNSMHNS